MGLKMSHFRFDDEAQTQGVWHLLGQGCRLLVARARNPEYLKVVQALRRPHAREFDQGTQSPELVIEILIKAMARTILKNWDNLHDEDGEPIPYTVENAETLLRDYPDFRIEVSEMSVDDDRYRSDLIREQVQELGNASNGSSNTAPSSIDSPIASQVGSPLVGG